MVLSLDLNLDIGNSRIAWLVSGADDQQRDVETPNKNNSVIACGQATEITDLINSIGQYIEQNLKQVDKSDRSVQPMQNMRNMRNIRVACVLQDKQKREELLNAIESHWQVQPRLAHTLQQHKGLSIAYADPDKLGVDRWLALLAATQLDISSGRDSKHSSNSTPKHQLIIDAGTATSIDLLIGSGEDFRHIGGLLIPGTQSIKEYFITRTQLRLDADLDSSGVPHLHNTSATALDTAWGTDSQSCLDLGVDGMFTNFIQHKVIEFFGDYPQGRVLISGGAGAELYQQLLHNPANIPGNVFYISHLVCQGLIYADI